MYKLRNSTLNTQLLKKQDNTWTALASNQDNTWRLIKELDSTPPLSDAKAHMILFSATPNK